MVRTRTFQIAFGSILIIIFIIISFFTLFIALGFRLDANRKLYSEFQNSSSEDVQKVLPRLEWTTGTEFNQNNGIVLGIAGVLPALVSLFILNRLRREIGKSGRAEQQQATRIAFASAIIFFVYVIVALLTAYVGEILFLLPLSEVAVALAFAAISCLSSYLYLFQAARKHYREEDLVLTEKDVQLMQFQLEHSGLTQILALSASVFFALIVGIFFVTYSQYYTTLPSVISHALSFRGLIFSIFAWAVVMVVGYYLGVISQIMGIIGDLGASLGKYKKEHAEKTDSARIFIVTINEDGSSEIGFGDGKPGAKLPTGQVADAFYAGIGKRGALPDEGIEGRKAFANRRQMLEFVGERFNRYLLERMPEEPGNYVVYLDVWEKQFTALDDPALIEASLGGIDRLCRSCGTRNANDALHCRKCGEKLKKV